MHGTDGQDRRLLDAAIWLGSEMAAGKATFGTRHLDQLSPEWSTILAVAAHNREHRVVMEHSFGQGVQAAEDAILFTDFAANRNITDAAGQQFSASALNEVGADLTENWLFDAAKATGGTKPPEDVAAIIIEATTAYSFRKAMNWLWNQVWWDDWWYDELDSGVTCWKASDPTFERLKTAWGMRQESNLMNLPFLDMKAWPKMKPAERRRWSRIRGVTALDGIGANQRFKVAALPCLSRKMPAYAIERAALEGVHLADFTGAKLPLVPNITADLLLLAWHIVLDVATLLAGQAPLPVGSLAPVDARKLALTVQRVALRRAIEEGLRIETTMADAIIEFLTFNFQIGGRKKAAGNKGLWAAPLVAIPQTDCFALCLSVLATSNIVRRVEAWLEKGGLDDRRVTTWPATTSRHAMPVPSTTESRGDRYETIIRSRICEAVARNRLFSTAACAKHEVKKTATFPEQIDLLVSFGGLCIVGEIKFFLMPADPHERDRYDEKLRAAAEQAKNKVAALQSQPTVLAAALNLDLASATKLRLLPIIVTAQGYRFSTRMDDVLVIDARFLKLYLTTSEVETGMALEILTGRSVIQTMTLYSTEEVAARNFEATMEAPYQLSRFLAQIEWREAPLPTLAHTDAVMEIPVVTNGGDTFDRMAARAAAEVLRRA